MRLNLLNLAIACIITGVQDIAASVIANGLLQDFRLISSENPTNVIDKLKI